MTVAGDKVFSGQTSGGNSAAIDWPGGIGSLIASGGFGGGALSLEVSPDNGTTWVPLGEDSLSQAGVLNFTCAGGKCLVRAKLGTATGATLNAWIKRNTDSVRQH